MKNRKSIVMGLAFAAAMVCGGVYAAETPEEAFTAFSKQIAPIQDQIMAKNIELNAAMRADQPDKAKVQQLFAEIGELRGQIAAARVDLDAKLTAAGVPQEGYGMHHNGMMRGDRGYGHGGSMRHGGGYGYGHGGGRHGGW